MRHVTIPMLFLAVACSRPRDPAPPTPPILKDTGPATTTPTDETGPGPETDTAPIRLHPCVARGPTEIAITRGYESWSPTDRYSILEPGEALPLYHLPDGGWGQYISFLAQNVPQRLYVEAEARRRRDGLLLSYEYDGAMGMMLISGTPGRPTPGPWDCEGHSSDILVVYDGDSIQGPARSLDLSPICGEAADLTIRLYEHPTWPPFAEQTVRVTLQPDPCDCHWCGPTAVDAPECAPGERYYDECFPGVPQCEIPETTPDDTSDTDRCPQVVP